MTRVCFVCLGNICRSPTAEGIMKKLARDAGVAIEVESAGIGGWHVGESPDPRTLACARRRGIILDSRAQQWSRAHFARFDYVLAMDVDNRDALLQLAPDDAARKKIHLLRDFDAESQKGSAVPDPYHGDADVFERVFDICERACRGLLQALR